VYTIRQAEQKEGKLLTDAKLCEETRREVRRPILRPVFEQQSHIRT